MSLDGVHIEVAAGVVRDDRRGKVLVARRPEGVHQGGLWEFPGGKLEAGETVSDALARELLEEIGITVHASTPLIMIEHAYPDRKVRLHVREIREFTGEPQGLEGQPVRWVSLEELDRLTFPKANHPIRHAVQLPTAYPILNLNDHPGDGIEQILAMWSVLGYRLVRFRVRPQSLSLLELRSWVSRARAYGIDVLVDGSAELVDAAGASGFHLTSKALRMLNARPLTDDLWVAASCHGADELAHAARIGVDFAVLGPVLPTASHPGASTLGWPEFRGLVDRAPFPVYALGGVGPETINLARDHGAQGVAGIRAFLSPAHAEGA